MHSSLSFLVSGQAQQIFFFGFESGIVDASDFWSFGSFDKDMVLDVVSIGSPPIVNNYWRS